MPVVFCSYKYSEFYLFLNCVDILCFVHSQECWVDEEGKYMDGAGPGLGGLSVLDEGNNKVLQLLGKFSACF